MAQHLVPIEHQQSRLALYMPSGLSIFGTTHEYRQVDDMDPEADQTEMPTSAAMDETGESARAKRATGRNNMLRKRRKDKAADLLEQVHERVVLTTADNRRVLRKIDLVILPIILIVYFLQALDKATLAYASVFGLLTDTHLGGEDYSWLGSIVYFAQLIMQGPVALALVGLPIGKFCGVVVLGWGVVLSCMAAAHDFSGLMATRFFLGAMEAAVAPAFIAVTQMWWRRQEQPNRISSWYAMNGVTNMFGSLLSWGLGHIHSSSLKSYQIIFLFCGLLTVAFSFVIFFYLPDSPMEAKFLNEHDKLVAIERLRMNQMGIMSRNWRWDHFWESLYDLKSYFWFAMIFSISIPSGGISTFGPLIVQSFGFDSFTTILFNIPFGFVQIVATVGGSFLATKFKVKSPVLALLCIPPIIGCIMLLKIDHVTGSKAALLVGYYLISVYPGITPLIYSWEAANTGGDTKRKCATAIMFVGQSAGNIIGPHLYTTGEAPGYTRGLLSNLVLFIVIIILIILTTIHLRLLNNKHGARRVAAGKQAVVVDTSMRDVVDRPEESILAPAAVEVEDVISPVANPDEQPRVPKDNDQPHVGDKAFDDETDLNNEDFIFVY